jgi:hypothetical protein
MNNADNADNARELNSARLADADGVLVCKMCCERCFLVLQVVAPRRSDG